MMKTEKNGFYLQKSTFLSLIFAFAFSIGSQVHAQNQPSPSELIQKIQSGGFILYFRHTATDISQKDTDLNDCKLQRNLSLLGIKQAERIGRNFKQLHIPVGQVWASPYCRTQDTAKLIFEKFKTDDNLKFSINQDKSELKTYGRHLRNQMLNRPSNKPNNLVFVGHTSNLKDAVDVWPRPEGVLAIFKKQSSQIHFIGFIHPNEWPVK